MKRSWLFAYSRYYPIGGFCDFKGSFDTLEECKAKFEGIDFEKKMGHVFDSETQKIVHQYYDQVDTYYVADQPELREVFPIEPTYDLLDYELVENVDKFQIGDIIVHNENGLPKVELEITDLSEDFMIQNEVSTLLNNNGYQLFRKERW